MDLPKDTPEGERKVLDSQILRATIAWDDSCARLAVWLGNNTAREWYAARFLQNGLKLADDLAAQKDTPL